ncbi:uncharacterized protein F4822DRAFT_401640 [Hypoxylon trugodes]|uniref:uncharacterized protein n=1 Tax=Hypoxylon trugodes TaxID=326681 RepID=UPI00219BAC1A|nr:uncharacterized protein F4822DRAFT_401640 [Hypoxylon trugodes]KAI1390357.1 hypothetical protein F4822DRAFT_401640 [Hypoxylon trugodes]
MKLITSSFAFPLAVATAAVAPRSGPAPPGPWTAGVWKIAQGTDIFFFGTAINANGGKFWINREPSAECPSDVEGLDCSAYPGSETVFTGGNGTLSLNVAVPGGQQVYIAEDGSLSYTVPHSGALPDGAVATGFARSRSEAFGAPVGLYNTGRYWSICPVGEGEPREIPYQLFIGDFKSDGCYGTEVRTYSADGVSAWEY